MIPEHLANTLKSKEPSSSSSTLLYPHSFDPNAFILQPGSTPSSPRTLTKEEKQRLLNEANDLAKQLMRVYTILDMEAMLMVCDLRQGVVLDRKANCAEMLVAANELTDMEREKNPIILASDIYNQRRTIFPKHEKLCLYNVGSGGHTFATHNGTNQPLPIVNPYQTIPMRHEILRGDLIREVGAMYTAMYRRSHTNTMLSIKEASIAQVEDIMRQYHKDGYKLSPGIKAYLTSHLSERKEPLGDIDGDPSLRSVQPICWDVQNVPYYVKSVIYKITDKRSSAEAKLRAKELTVKRQKLQKSDQSMLKKEKAMIIPSLPLTAASSNSSLDEQTPMNTGRSSLQSDTGEMTPE